MEDAGKKKSIDLNNLDGVEDPGAPRNALLEKHAAGLESGYARRRREPDEFKERMRAEVNGLKARSGGPGREKDATP